MVLTANLKVEDFYKIIFDNETLELSETLLSKVENGFNFLEEFSKDKVIYGVNTGFGPMAQYRISEENRNQLQYNLIRSHSSGVGNPLSPQSAKAVMLARLNTLSLGKSGIHPSVIFFIKGIN